MAPVSLRNYIFPIGSCRLVQILRYAQNDRRSRHIVPNQILGLRSSSFASRQKEQSSFCSRLGVGSLHYVPLRMTLRERDSHVATVLLLGMTECNAPCLSLRGVRSTTWESQPRQDNGNSRAQIPHSTYVPFRMTCRK